MNAPMRLTTRQDECQASVVAKLELALERAKKEGWTFVAIVGESPDGLRTMLSEQSDILRRIGALQQALFTVLHEWHHET